MESPKRAESTATGAEETLGTPMRRITRRAATTPKHQQTPNNLSKTLQKSLKLNQQEETIDLPKILRNEFPGRDAQIKELLRIIGAPEDPMPPVLVYGGPSTGKTALILSIFKSLRRPFAYASCRSCFTPRLLFESVLNQLTSHTRTASNNYASALRCDKIYDFVSSLKDACGKAVKRSKKQNPNPSIDILSAMTLSPQNPRDMTPGKVSSKGDMTPGKVSAKRSDCSDDEGEDIVYLVIDNVDLVLDWNNGSALISALFKLCDLTRMSNLGLVFISNAAPDAFFFQTGTLEPLGVHFRDYNDDELRQILLKGQANPQLYGSFLNASLKPFSRASRRVTELSTSLQPLFKKYCENAGKEMAILDEKEKRRLFALLEPHIAPALNQVFHVETYGASAVGGEKIRRRIAIKSQHPSEIALEDLDFHLSVCGKYLLISAFIASRNPATLDATLFDSTGEANNRKRKRKSAVATERNEMEAQEKLLKGPGSFPLERLLAIFQCITAVGDEEMENYHTDSILTYGEGGSELMADALMQLASLCNINLLYKGSSCPLEGACRYRCNIDEELALKIARSVNFPLSKYLYRGS